MQLACLDYAHRWDGEIEAYEYHRRVPRGGEAKMSERERLQMYNLSGTVSQQFLDDELEWRRTGE